ncbi:MAG: iron-containing redox enzyme family protein [Acidimicrobiales bacterium]
MTVLSPPPAGPDPIGPGFPERLPAPRGPVTDQLLDHLSRPVHELGSLPRVEADPVSDDDLALALHLMYELHYLGLPGVDEGWEWEPSLLRERRTLEGLLERRLVELVGHVPVGLSRDATIAALQDLAAQDGPSLSAHMAERGTLEEMREFVVHRSGYQLKEADPHTWAIPRLTGRSKAALVDIQRGEYGDGRPADVHANVFAEVMVALDLEPTYGAYVDALPGITLSTGNLVSLFGLHRRWRGALVGHLALFEMCSVGPMGRYQAALERLGFGPDATRFYAAHVQADERHQRVALVDMVGGLVDQEPFLGGEVVFGARSLDALERAFTAHLLDAWSRGGSSLRRPGLRG